MLLSLSPTPIITIVCIHPCRNRRHYQPKVRSTCLCARYITTARKSRYDRLQSMQEQKSTSRGREKKKYASAVMRSRNTTVYATSSRLWEKLARESVIQSAGKCKCHLCRDLLQVREFYCSRMQPYTHIYSI